MFILFLSEFNTFWNKTLKLAINLQFCMTYTPAIINQYYYSQVYFSGHQPVISFCFMLFTVFQAAKRTTQIMELEARFLRLVTIVFEWVHFLFTANVTPPQKENKNFMISSIGTWNWVNQWESENTSVYFVTCKYCDSLFIL